MFLLSEPNNTVSPEIRKIPQSLQPSHYGNSTYSFHIIHFHSVLLRGHTALPSRLSWIDHSVSETLSALALSMARQPAQSSSLGGINLSVSKALRTSVEGLLDTSIWLA